MFAIRPVVFFAIAGLMMDSLFYNGILTDTYFADSIFHASQSTQGMLGGVSAMGYAVGCLIFGPLSEHSGRRAMTVASVIGVFLCFIGLIFCQSLKLLLALMLIKRFIAAMFWPALMAWLADVSLPQNLGRNLCVFNVGWATGNIIGSYFPGHFGEWMATTPGGYNAQACYTASAVAAIFLLLWLTLFTPRSIAEASKAPPILTPSGTRLFLVQGWIAHLAIYATVALCVFMFPRLAAMPHLNLTTSGQSTLHSLRLVINLLSFVALYFTSAWHYRFYPVYGGLTVGAWSLLLMGYGPNYATVLLGQLMLGLAMGVIYTTSQYYSLMLPQTKGKGSGVHEMLVGLAYVIGPALGGYAAHLTGSPRAPFAAGLAPILLAILVVVLIRKRVRDGRTILHAPSVPAD